MPSTAGPVHPDWCRSAVIYQITTRSFTPEGTFAAAAEQLPRLADLGVQILWLAPIHPIGQQHRKGSLGSPYSVADYLAVNPEHGTLEDLRAFVDRAHRLGLQVLLDWVAHHTSWDNPLLAEHPSWYLRDESGNVRRSPLFDWSDIIDLDWRQPGLHDYLAEAMTYWVRTLDIDGFRCDVAGLVPLEFWIRVRAELERIKPVFLLAEWESPDMHQAFDATYAWSWHSALVDLVAGRGSLRDVRRALADSARDYGPGALRLSFLTNHDLNAWEGTHGEQFGPAVAAAMVLSVLGPGLPLIFNGQEAGLDRRLAFFDNDQIAWRDHPHGRLYRRLLALKRANPAVANGAWGGRVVPVGTDRPGQVLCFRRARGAHRVVVALNLSPRPVLARFTSVRRLRGSYRDLRSGELVQVTDGAGVDLPPWGWQVLFTG